MIDEIENLPINITYTGEAQRDTWRCDKWTVALTNKAGYWSTDYYTGLGLRDKSGKPKRPAIADVLSALIQEADSADQNFIAWCSECGLSDDSIKAFNMYKSCIDTGIALRKYLGADVARRARELLKDY